MSTVTRLYADVAKDYGVCVGTIAKIKQGKSYTWVK